MNEKYFGDIWLIEPASLLGKLQEELVCQSLNQTILL